jgi:outer membrane protein TolC
MKYIYLLPALLTLSLVSSCTQGFYQKWADRQVFRILKNKSKNVPGAQDETLSSIDPPSALKLDELARQSEKADFLGERAQIEKGAHIIDLAKALEFAITRNREYLREKEDVYLSALRLTEVQQNFSLVPRGAAAGTLSQTQVRNSFKNWITQPTLLDSTGNLGLNYLSRLGTRLALDLSTDFSRVLTSGAMNTASSSRAAATLTQPFLNGAGILAASEPLRQEERNVLYAIRDFTQYRKKFVVAIASSYWRAQFSREQAKNRYTAYQTAKKSLERERAMAEAGIRSQSQLKQFEQSSLNFENNWLGSVRVYEDRLDDLKILLGLPVAERIVLNTSELKQLKIIHPKDSMEAFTQTAVETRLDLWNSREQVEDSGRKIRIAHQSTLPILDGFVNYRINADGPVELGSSQYNVDAKDRRLQGGLIFDPNLNTLPERNDLRAAQIQKQRAQRQLELNEDVVRNLVRKDWRGLQLALNQYQLSVKALQIAETRLEIESALLEEGQGTARDIVESQDRLINARDALVGRLIDHNISRLELWADMGVLSLQPGSSWQTVLKQETATLLP